MEQNRIEVIIPDATLRKAAALGMDSFVKCFTDSILNAIGGALTQENITRLTSDQVTLLAWQTLHEELMDGGFVQLIHNGYGPFIFKNPLAKALKQWGLRDLSKLIYEGHTLYLKYAADIERDCTDEEFMALFERYPEFDDLDDNFIEHEEEWTAQIARYVDNHLENFATID